MKASIYVEGHVAEVDVDLGEILQDMLNRRSEEDIRSVECAISDFYSFVEVIETEDHNCVLADMSESHKENNEHCAV